MSSSKITTFDLDPNLDMATESSLIGIKNDVSNVRSDTTQILAAVTTSSGGIKKIQRGTATSAGTITIEEVVMEKTMVLSVSKGSAGTVAARGTLKTSSASLSYKSAYNTSTSYSDVADSDPQYETYTATIPALTGTLSGGTTDLYVKEYSAKLTSSTTLICDGACEWQVIEFN